LTTPEQEQTHQEWLRKLNLKESDLVFYSETYQLEMRFLSPQILYEEHSGVIDENAAQEFLKMSNLISDSIKKYAPNHRAAVVADVANLKRVSRRARKMLIQDIEQWDPMIGISFAGANLVVRAIGYAVVRKMQTIDVSFHPNFEEALAEAKRLCAESHFVTPLQTSDFFNLPMDNSAFSQMWKHNPKTIRLQQKNVRVLQKEEWRYVSKTTTAKIVFSVLDNQILLVEVSGAVAQSDIEHYYGMQDGILEELKVKQINLILDTRKLTWSDAASRRYGESYYVNNQHRYPHVTLIASRFVRFIVRSFTILSRHKFMNWHLANSLEEAFGILSDTHPKPVALYEEVARDGSHEDLQELNQVVVEQRDIIKQYHAHMDLLLQNITRSSWDDILKPTPMPVENDDLFGDVYGAIELMQNDYLELVMEREQATARAEEANRLKSLFLARMSHDLRTPLNSILGFTDVLTAEESDEKKVDVLRMIENSAEQLKDIINDLLEISSIEAGTIRVQMQNINFYDLIEQVVQSQRPNAEKKGLEVLLELGPNTPQIIYSDKGKLQQILLNLLTNSIKYTDVGGIFISASAIKQNPNSSKITVSIRDTGRGIPKGMHGKVFDAFRQVEETALHPVEGKGLGLAICRELIQCLGGSIELQSEEGQGSTFSIHFNTPINIESTNQPMQASAHPLSGHVLIVEDNKINQRVLEKMLQRIGVQISIAQNGREAIELLNENTNDYSLVLMDCQMPTMNGWETTKFIRNDLQMDVPILALTAFAQKEDIDRSKAVGMNGFLAKPVRLHELRSTLADFLPAQEPVSR
tara:strand:- start:1775 stop:4204 length:2430 start_codon:yes stop_codon:yes gene_type:complete